MDLRDYGKENVFNMHSEICCILHTQMVAERMQPLNSSDISEVLVGFFLLLRNTGGKKLGLIMCLFTGTVI